MQSSGGDGPKRGRWQKKRKVVEACNCKAGGCRLAVREIFFHRGLEFSRENRERGREGEIFSGEIP